MDEIRLMKAIVGSQAYGTATPTSDEDFKGIYVQNPKKLLGFGYKEQVEVSKDEVYYEVRRFLELIRTANPTVLELLYSPPECILETSPAYELMRSHRSKFLTKKCRDSFGGYAVAQIKKARGTNKKMNMEESKVARKTPFDFCYVYLDGKSIPLAVYLKQQEMLPEFCGLAKLDHIRDGYALYYDYAAQYGKDRIHHDGEPLGYRGICGEDSNELVLSSIPKDAQPSAFLHFNKDGYSSHCKEYREYKEWLEKRNLQRFVDVTSHGQKIDGKNMLHCRRLLDMALEIATTGDLIVKRPNADYLLSIRRGEVDLTTLLGRAEADIARLDETFANSGLPDEVDDTFVNDLLLDVRGMVRFT